MYKMILMMIAICLCCGSLQAKSDPRVNRFLQMSATQATEYLNDAINNKAYRIRDSLIDAAIAARRMDLIEVCFRSPHTCFLTLDALGLIQDLGFKDRVVLMLLKADFPSFWPEERPFIDGKNISPRQFMREPFSEVLLRHFPDFPSDGKPFATRASRLELAAELEKIIGVAEEPAEHPAPVPESAQTEKQDSAASAPLTPDEEAPERKPLRQSVGLWIALASLLVMLLGAAGFLMKRRDAD